MTTETRILIEFSDIFGVEFECPHCGAKIVYPLAKPYQRLGSLCPSCNEGWFAPQNPAAHPSTPSVAKQVFEGLLAFQQLLSRSDIHARVRLQVNGLAQPK
jgi:predicted RNA-binding Zn-ribbon protein involved in translation (DUF1610 family)